MTAAGRRRASQAGTGAQLRVFNLVWTSLIVIHIWAAPVEGPQMWSVWLVGGWFLERHQSCSHE